MRFFGLLSLVAVASAETATVKATLRFTGKSWGTAGFTAQKQAVLAKAVSKSVGWPADKTSVISFKKVVAPNTCDKVEIAGLQRHLSGVYSYVQDLGGRPAYKLSSGYYLYFYSHKKYWMVGSKLGSSSGVLVVNDQSKTIAGIKKSWYRSSKKGWTRARGLTVKCQVVPVLDVTLQLKAAGCKAPQLAALKPLSRQFDQLVEEQNTFVRQLRVLGFVTKDVKESTVIIHPKCDVRMSLSMPDVKKLPGNVQAACQHDGHHLQVTLHHKGHDSFACKHQKNAAGVIECNCNTWDSSLAMKKVQKQEAAQVAAP